MMMVIARASGTRLRVAAAGMLAASALAWLAPAVAQRIRIPDFRESPTRAELKPGEACDRCGVIRSIREIESQRPVAVPKVFQTDSIDHGPGSTIRVGAVAYLPLGEGTDKPFVGGVGTPEMRYRFTESTYEIVVRLDSGGYTTVQRRDGASFRIDDRVRVEGTQLELLAP